jgi:hypothetical protein
VRVVGGREVVVRLVEERRGSVRLHRSLVDSVVGPPEVGQGVERVAPARRDGRRAQGGAARDRAPRDGVTQSLGDRAEHGGVIGQRPRGQRGGVLRLRLLGPQEIEARHLERGGLRMEDQQRLDALRFDADVATGACDRQTRVAEV